MAGPDGDEDGRISLGHGGGGRLSQQLIQELLLPAFGPADGVLHDAALLPHQPGRLAFSTDSFVVRPLLFPGGDIGRLAVCGSVNDLAMAGATPVALSLALILEEGLAIAALRRVIASIRATAEACGVPVVTGDTKVVERGQADGIYINTSAIGRLEGPLTIHPGAVRPGDAVLVSGDLGRHGLAILAARGELGLSTDLESDLAPLLGPVRALLAAGLTPHCLRDLTRGGLAGAIDEIARGAGCQIELEEQAIPLHPAVAGACELLGLDPLAMANEGRMVLLLPEPQAEAALAVLRHFQPQARRIGMVRGPIGQAARLEQLHPVCLRGELGVRRPLELGSGEQLPRIC
ncbi:MAG: hydrogenase expression/formation protein HypE [Vulcanococcus sp.]